MYCLSKTIPGNAVKYLEAAGREPSGTLIFVHETGGLAPYRLNQVFVEMKVVRGVAFRGWPNRGLLACGGWFVVECGA